VRGYSIPRAKVLTLEYGEYDSTRDLPRNDSRKYIWLAIPPLPPDKKQGRKESQKKKEREKKGRKMQKYLNSKHEPLLYTTVLLADTVG
jgi:hypothetical protein